MRPESWHAEIASLEREIELEGFLERTRQDAEDLAEAVGSFAGSVVDLEALDRDYQAAKRFDVSEVREVGNELQAADLEGAEFLWPGGTDPIQASKEIAELQAQLASFDEAQVKHGELEAGLRVQMAMDSLISRTLLCTSDEALLASIVRRVNRKLATVSEGEILDLWSRVLRQFQESRWHGHLPRDAAFIPERFFVPCDQSEMRERIAVFIGWLQERLRAKAAEQGHQAFPMGVPGVASVLTARASLVRPIQDRRLAACLARICGLLGEGSVARFSQAAGLASDGWLATSDKHRKQLHSRMGTPSDESARSKLRMLLRLLDRLVLYLENYVSLEAPIDRALLQYRLGLEVTLPGSRKEVEGNNEIELQKRLCRFLLERGVYAVGTKFGQSEIDLLLKSGPATYVIETKIYRAAPTPARLRKDLAQLQTYMGQQPLAPRGVLLIYNLSERVIIADRVWLQGRYHVLAINLPKEPPSATSQTFLVTHGDGPELATFVANEAAGRVRRAREHK